MNTLVTGANSYLGGWTVHELLQAGHNVCGTDSHGGFLFAHGMPKEGTLDAVVHLAWRAKVGDGEAEAQEGCLDRTLRLVDSLRERGGDGRLEGWRWMKGHEDGLERVECPTCKGKGLLVESFNMSWSEGDCPKCQGKGNVVLVRPRGELPKLVFASTASVYAPSLHSPARNELTQEAPSCAYSWAKFKAEEHIRQSGLPHAILRLGSLFGAGVEGGRTKVGGLMVNAFAVAALRDGVIPVWHPDCWRPVLHVRDAAEIIKAAVEQPEMEGTLNAAHCSFRAIDCAYLVRDVLGNHAQVGVRDAPSGSVGHSVRLNCNRAIRLLPHVRMRTVRDGVLELRRWVEAGGSDVDEVSRWER